MPEDQPIEPLDALRRIAFLLERSRAGTYRVKAFRQAADTVVSTPRDELEHRAQTGTLQDLPGIGKATEAVIREALAGERPAYLASLEEKSPERLAEGGERYRAALRGDCHCHSDWSDGGSPIPEMVATAMELGHEYLVLTDHSPSLRVANGLSVERLTKQLKLIDRINENTGSFTLLKGIEVDILDDGSLDQRPDLLARLDVRVASVHSKLKMARAPMTQRMIGAVRDPHTNILGHCTGRMVDGERRGKALRRDQSAFDAEAVFAECAAHDVAVEINSRPERQDPPDELIALAVAAGCLFSIDSDAHAPGQLDFVEYGCERAERLAVPLDRIVNTWPKERLLEWADKR
ncbi:PHP domain-containing protein [Flexivirga caeni]|uniref:PHP domain-containing protein n=1 Tax=Flexivirga caeni TaxID=2294115 RepID=A0A3M9MJ86_9MICO|nr:PHP domain-containing protein [Flexivirga caeni]RNI25237.1 PHP domain-containing protein [Flexivirga caeni]